jgi:serine/threonine protein kinase
MKTAISTYGFFAPEMLVPNAKFHQNVDVYATGVILYMLLATKPYLDKEKRLKDKCYQYSIEDFMSPHDHKLK